MKQMVRILLFTGLVSLFVSLAAACSSLTVSVPVRPESPLAGSDSPLPTPALRPDLELGKAAVVGRLISPASGQPLANKIVRLPEVYCPEDVAPEQKETRCFWALDDAFSPSTFSDEYGYFEFVNVEERDYILLVGDVLTNYALALKENEKPILYTTTAGQELNLGDVMVVFE